MTCLICPICGEPLTESARALFCANGHSFDIAASGYCNLLRPGKKRNRTSGDDREMVASRGRFLDTGAYRPVLDYIISKLAVHAPGGILLDAGCGEGYYTCGIAAAADKLSVIGVDASKYAADAASRRARRLGIPDRVRFITGTAAGLPVADGSANAVLSLFAPCYYGEFARATRPGGCLLIGSSGVKHLCELKSVLYSGDVRPNVPIEHPSLASPYGYTLKSRENVTYTVTIEGRENILALFSMTPYRWRTPRDGVEALSRLDTITVTVDVDFSLLQLTGDQFPKGT